MLFALAPVDQQDHAQTARLPPARKSAGVRSQEPLVIVRLFLAQVQGFAEAIPRTDTRFWNLPCIPGLQFHATALDHCDVPDFTARQHSRHSDQTHFVVYDAAGASHRGCRG